MKVLDEAKENIQQEVEVQVNGRPVRQIAHEGKIFIIAKAGQKYEIKLKNNSTSRVLGVCGVDGRNVVDGEPSTPNGTGYIINGYGSYLIKGFRTSNDEVHPFIFDRKSESYAAKVNGGTPQDCGVIGVVFHAEKYVAQKVVIKKEYVPYYPNGPYYRRYPYIHPYDVQPYWAGWGNNWQYTTSDTLYAGNGGGAQAATFNSGQSAMMNSCSTSVALNQGSVLRSISLSRSAEFDLGTKFSDNSVEDKVVNSEFEKGYELGRIEIYYASRSQLESMGVPVEMAKAVAFPQAFTPGFCKPPRK